MPEWTNRFDMVFFCKQAARPCFSVNNLKKVYIFVVNNLKKVYIFVVNNLKKVYILIEIKVKKV